MNDINVKGMAIAPNVIETIVSMAVSEVEGVASVCVAPATGFLSNIAGKAPEQVLEVTVLEDESLSIRVHVELWYGCVLTKVAEEIRTAVADAISTQVGLNVSEVDVCIDAIRFVD